MIFHFWRNGNGNARAGGPHTFISLGIQKWNEMSHSAALALHSLFHSNISVKHSINRKPKTSTNVALNSFSVTLLFITEMTAPYFISPAIPYKSVWLLYHFTQHQTGNSVYVLLLLRNWSERFP